MDIEAMLIDSGAGVKPDDAANENQKPNGEEKPNGEQTPGATEKPTGEDGKGALPEQIDFSKTFDGFESVEQVKEFAERGKKYTPEVESEFENLRQVKEQYETIKTDYEKLKTANPYKDERFYKLDKLAEAEEPNIDIYQKYLLGKPSDLDVVKMDLVLKHGKIFKDNPEALQRRIESKYPALFDGSDKDDDEYKDALISLQLDAEAARGTLDSKLNEIQLPNATQTEEEKKAADTEFIKSWQSDFAKIKDGLTAIPINVTDEKGDGKEIPMMDFKLSEEESANLQQIAAAYIANNRLKPTPENVEAAKKVAIGSYIVNNLAKIQTAFANKLEEETGMKWRAKVTNPYKGGAEHSPQNKQVKLDGSADSIMEDITHGFGY